MECEVVERPESPRQGRIGVGARCVPGAGITLVVVALAIVWRMRPW